MNNNFEAINYYKELLNNLGELNELNEIQYRSIARMINILFDTEYEDNVAFIDGPHNSKIKDKYESELDYIEINTNPMVKEVKDNNIDVSDIEIPSIVPTLIEDDILNEEVKIDDFDELGDSFFKKTEENNEEISDDNNLDEETEQNESENSIDNEKIIDSFYKKSQENNEELDTIKRIEGTCNIPNDENFNIEEDKEIRDSAQTIEYIPGTEIPKPRDRKIDESDEEYVDYLKNHYNKYSDLLINKEKSELLDPTPKEKERFEVKNVFTPVKSWSDKFKKLLWPKVKKVMKKIIIPVAIATAILAGVSTCTHEKAKNMNNNDLSIENVVDNYDVPNELGQLLTLNDGTPIFERPDFVGKYGMIGEGSALYDSNTLFMVNAINTIDNNTNERKEFNLLEKEQEEKRKIIDDYLNYTINNDYTIESYHVTPANENGEWLYKNGLGAWLNPNASYINNYNNKSERSLS